MKKFCWNLEGGALCLLQGDITAARVDAVVNAANSSLAGGGGVDGAIHRAAGPQLLEACMRIVAEQGRLPAGQAVTTPGFNMPAKYVIHTVGPIWRGGNAGEPETLRSAWLESLREAEANGAAVVAFPAISTGVYGYPVELAAPLALKTAAESLASMRVEAVHVYLHGESSWQAWSVAARDLLGEPHETEQ
ncbi:O-acetyl-ADP-ribose deacetylase [Oceanidesulfovibrio marinus]|uniref:O-acetyl-ADP-ribose deacetylase n=1 Tax=Oceanidesulfovibrio marinus TaxID=370038 RepID=A0A6P1ZK56_9BACT|nr:O-acetyl-ADP-ribose deacetylase [Oceanidesulfovibrio marinus]QJT08242.1 O-acetyl-ADP-ribose deacetylase [Oceanidesulfovibrio marinus]TVM35135.1 O-acetyl-ADP-ribose deacetylase [Oceanidesulfovibrio marinus]